MSNVRFLATSARGGFLLNRRNLTILVSGLLTLQVLLPVLLAMPATAVPLCGISTQEEPVQGSGSWNILGTVRITEGCQFSYDGDVQILGHSAGALFIEGGALTVTGWINITQGGVLDISQGGQLHVEGSPSARLRVSNGASFRAEAATVELQGLDAPGTSNQGSISLTNVTLVAHAGVFSATTNSLVIERSTVTATVPAAGAGQPGGSGILNLGGRIVGSVVDSHLTLNAANGGVGTQGADGGPGGSATSLVQARRVTNSDLRIVAGVGGSGGTGPPGGVAGGRGGQGGAATLTMTADEVFDSTIEVIGGAGGVGGNGGSSSNGSGGNGGAGRPGGNARFSLMGYEDLDIAGTTLHVDAGAGGTGGSGGRYEGNSATDSGGDAASGASGGWANAWIDAPQDVRIVNSDLRAKGAPGGLGGAYGPSVVATSLSSGRAGNGGPGGPGTINTNATANSLTVSGSQVTAIGGAGGTGGEGDQEGGSGGDGANSLAAAHAHFDIDFIESCYSSEGGNGGAARDAFLAVGHGGRGGKGNVTIISDGGYTVHGGCLGARSGKGGRAEHNGVPDPLHEGADGLQADLWVDSDRLEMFDATIRNALNDYNGTQPGHLYNVTFDLPVQGQSPVIPRGAAPVYSYWNLTILVTDGQDPIQGVQVSVDANLSNCPEATSFYDQSQTGADGTVTFTLVSHKYTSQVGIPSFVGCYDAESSYEGRFAEPDYVALESNRQVLFRYPSNNYPPKITFLQPGESIYRIDADHPTIPLEIIVADPDDAITGVESKLTVWACMARDPTCFDRTDISDSLVQDQNTGEKRYYAQFNVTNVNEWPGGQYFVCTKASDGQLESVWTCQNVSLVQIIRAIPEPELSPGGTVHDTATKTISFNGRVNNMDTLQNFDPSIGIMIYRWDFDGDGDWDYYSSTSGQTVHLYPNVDQTTTYRANFSVVDTLGRESPNVTREVTIDPFVVTPPGFLWTYAFVIFYTVLGAVALTGGAYSLQRRRQRIEAEEAKRREAEILANIHECQRCGDLLPAKFAVCVRCATEDSIASVKKTVAELKHVGVIVLEEEDLIEKAFVSFEGRDFETANAFLEKVKGRVEVNKKRHKHTTDLIRRERLHIRMLQEQGKDVVALEPELYHAELALGRSDFDGADRMVEGIRTKLQAVVYEDKRREILSRFTKLERKIKGLPPAEGDEEKAAREKATGLMQRAKLALGKANYVESVENYKEAFTLIEGAPPEIIVTEPTDEELDLFETRMKMVEEGVYMGPAQKAGEETEKVWRPGERDFDVGKGEDFKPHEGAGSMQEERAHGRTFGEKSATEAKAEAPAEAEAQPEGGVEPEAEAAQQEAPPAPPEEAGVPVAEEVSEGAPPPAEPEPPVAPAAPAREAPAAEMACEVCGTALKPGWKRCPKCATPVPGVADTATTGAPAAPSTKEEPSAAPAGPEPPAKSAPTHCPNCRKPVKPNWKKCPYCATPLT